MKALSASSCHTREVSVRWCHLPLISLKCSLRFPDNFHKIRHNGVVKGVGGAWRRVEPIGGYTKGGAYRGGGGGNIPSFCNILCRGEGHISLGVAQEAWKGRALGGFPLPMRARHFNPISFACIFGENLRFAFEENPHFLEKHKGHKSTEYWGVYRVKGGNRVAILHFSGTDY